MMSIITESGLALVDSWKHKVESEAGGVVEIGVDQCIPGLSCLPTKRNRQIWALDKQISALILKVVKERQQAGREKDLLQTLLEGAKSSYSTSAAIDSISSSLITAETSIQLDSRLLLCRLLGVSCCWLRTRNGKRASEMRLRKFVRVESQKQRCFAR
ncbi:UNVERIFIED_CONTAM: hypothetical protein Sangu_1634900 [Sesamum angustifolium]|uniref:Uncharacterized protein n=1 Tax=Sesamum angustifolium TaxID=2727405 RepID=A0AAW2MJE7_9LAMI